MSWHDFKMTSKSESEIKAAVSFLNSIKRDYSSGIELNAGAKLYFVVDSSEWSNEESTAVWIMLRNAVERGLRLSFERDIKVIDVGRTDTQVRLAKDQLVIFFGESAVAKGIVCVEESPGTIISIDPVKVLNNEASLKRILWEDLKKVLPLLEKME